MSKAIFRTFCIIFEVETTPKSISRYTKVVLMDDTPRHRMARQCLKGLYQVSNGPGSVVSIATGYRLDGPGIESRWGARLSTPVQTSPGAHPASSKMGSGSFPGVKSGRGVTLTPHPF